jgi:arylsulfatase A-like enzyme
MSNHKKQVIFIMTDTQRHDMLGCYGNKDMQTPYLDQMAAEGIRYDKAYTCQPVCQPARAALFTGLFPHSCGGWTNSTALGDNVKTLGQRLRDNKIHAGYIGKWHLDGGDYFGLGQCPDGWDPDYWYDMKNYLDELTPEERVISRDASNLATMEFSEEFCYAHRVSDRAVKFLDKFTEEDFFLSVSYDEPHGPFICPPKYAHMYKDYTWPDRPNFYDDLKNKPDYQWAWAGKHLEEDRSNFIEKDAWFLGCNSFVDYEIGRVLEAARKKAPDALIIYTSDHGDFMGSHRLSGKGPAFYEEITHIPFLVKWPGHIKPGSSSDHPMTHIDVTPTVMDYMGLNLPVMLEGKSLLPEFKDPAVLTNDVTFTEFGRYEIDHDGFGGFQPMRCCFDGRYKLSINLMSTDELYDMSNDPQEMNNLIDSPEHNKIRDGLHDRILNWMNETRDPFRGYYWERRPWRKDARPATWDYTLMTRQRENEEYEHRQLDYSTGLPMKEATRKK